MKAREEYVEVISLEGIPGSEAYVGIAVEVYGTKYDMSDFDHTVVRAGEAFAKANGLPWPPEPMGPIWEVNLRVWG